jgi:hypothetical protein
VALSPRGFTPALVDRGLWEATQKQRASNTGAKTRNQARPYLLRGMVVCAVCGRKMRPSPESRGRLIYRAITVVANGRDWRVSGNIPSASLTNLLCNGLKVLTPVVGADTLDQCLCRQEACWCQNRPLAMDPPRFNGVEPGTLAGQWAENQATAPLAFDTLVVGCGLCAIA